MKTTPSTTTPIKKRRLVTNGKMDGKSNTINVVEKNGKEKSKHSTKSELKKKSHGQAKDIKRHSHLFSEDEG